MDTKKGSYNYFCEKSLVKNNISVIISILGVCIEGGYFSRIPYDNLQYIPFIKSKSDDIY